MKPIWIDTDCGVDDALGLLVAMAQKELHIVGMSAVAGNVTLDHTFENTRNVVYLAHRDFDIPVYRGSDTPLFKSLYTAGEVHGDDGLGGVVIPQSPARIECEDAIDAMYRAACEYEHDLEVITIGPMTNLAKAILKYPDIKNKIKRVLFMGGSAGAGNTTTAAEFNAYADPDAMEICLQAGIPIIMFGLDCTMKCYITPRELFEIRTMNKVGTFVAECSKSVLGFYKKVNGKEMLIFHDTCPILYLLHEEAFSGKMAGVHCETLGSITRGKTVTDLYTDTKFDIKNCKVMLDADRTALLSYIKEAILSYSE